MNHKDIKGTYRGTGEGKEHRGETWEAMSFERNQRNTRETKEEQQIKTRKTKHNHSESLGYPLKWVPKGFTEKVCFFAFHFFPPFPL